MRLGTRPQGRCSPGMKPGLHFLGATLLTKQREDTTAPGSLVYPQTLSGTWGSYIPTGPDPRFRPFLWPLGSLGLGLGPSRANF